MEYKYDGCSRCLVNTCCQYVCEEYKYHLYKTTGCEILIKDISLKKVETILSNDKTMVRKGLRCGIV